MNTRDLEWIVRLLNPLVLHFDRASNLFDFSGDPSFYGLSDSDIKHNHLTDILPELVGIDVREEIELLLIGLQSNIVVNIYLNPHKQGFDVLILESEKSTKTLQEVQQRVHDVHLDNIHGKRLQKKIKNLNSELMETSNAKSLFISGMSHEFRTPIMGMLGNIAWIEKDFSEDSENLKKLKSIETNATYLLGLVDNLLNQGKLSNDTLKISRDGCHPKRLLHSVIETMLPVAQQRDIILAHEIKLSDELYLFLDEYHLRRVLYNLIGNAIKFTDFGSVLVNVGYSESSLKFDIIDTGIGIPEDNLTKVLLPFTRADNVVHRRGIGLGLSYANEIVSAMGGKINLKSVLGKGTKISFDLPASPAGAHRKRNESSVLNSGQVLLVEDSSEIISLYNYYFHDSGIDLQVVSNGSDLEKYLRRSSPLLLLVDHLLGQENGLELVSKARQKGYSGYIILLTASVDAGKQLETIAIEAGCDEYMQKPADVYRLVEKVRSKLKSIKSHSEHDVSKQLLDEYILSFPEKCQALSDQIARLKSEPENLEFIESLRFQVHKISGSAGSYGFPQISTVSIELEKLVNEYEKSIDAVLLPDILSQGKRLIKELEKNAQFNQTG